MHGRVPVRAALPPTAAVSAWRIVPSGHLPTTLRDEHLSHDGRSATTRLSTALPDHHRHSDGPRTRVPTTMRLRRGRQRFDHMPAAMSPGRRNERHGDDRLSTALPDHHRLAHL
jgi:hypothetical protein